MALCAAAQPAGQTTPRALQRHYSSRQARREGSLTSFPAGRRVGLLRKMAAAIGLRVVGRRLGLGLGLGRTPRRALWGGHR